MKLVNKILLATDFNKSSESALKTAVLIARKFKSEITLIHVIPKAPDVLLPWKHLKQKSTARLRDIEKEITKSGVKLGKTLLIHGIPFHQIIQHADYLDVNVIIMGAGEKERNDKNNLGTHAERVMRKARKPVFVVKQGSSPRIKKILCPVDCSASSSRALTNAVHLARNFKAELTVFYVIRTWDIFYPGMGKAPAGVQKTYIQDETAKFNQFLKSFDFHDVKWNKKIKQGVPYEEILKTARRINANCLVVGILGETGLPQILMGSVAKKIAHDMPCPLLAIKSENAVRAQLESEAADIEARLNQGCELLEKGFPEEALAQFEICITKNMLCIPALEGKAVACERLGHKDDAKTCREKAEHIAQTIGPWDKLIEKDMRRPR